jgi:4-hydroxy-3-methylbut-2-enyl diphosphate reductase
MSISGLQVLLASPRGFCAGVDRAIEIVDRALELYGPPVYVLHEIVHNRHVLEDFRGRGVHFVETLEDVPRGAVTIFSAHGVAEEVERKARERGLCAIDATCPLVTKVHLQARRYEDEERELVLIGHPGHPEIVGTQGRFHGRVHVLSTVEEVERLVVADAGRLAYVTQTTLSVDDTRDVIAALKRRFPGIQGPNLSDICYATQNRQNAVKALSDDIDLLLVVGSQNSSNSNRLRELGARKGVPSYLIDTDQDLEPAWLAPGMRVGLTAGASAPESLVRRVIARLRELGAEAVHEMAGEPENVVFSLPSELRPGTVVDAGGSR